ncbi:2,3-bisphosphoglycerate-independent phosphoglycerate mutase [bacterium]|nr:2,3-bisphosphoglycerate-independent phosphoglycerate mutase [bacterium]
MDISVVERLVQNSETKILQIILDGLGDIHSATGQTPLESANTPNLDKLAKESSLGLVDPIFPGITPGSGPGHLALFGYDPLINDIGRGVLEALGIGLTMKKEAVYARGNFCTLDENKIVLDRRAGRIPTEKNEKICEKINIILKDYKELDAKVYTVKEHRFVLEILDDKLDFRLNDADPQKVDLPYKYIEEKLPEAKQSADKINKLIDYILKGINGDRVNGILLRGFARDPGLATFEERFKLTPIAIAQYPMYKGLASLVGMTLAHVGPNMIDLAKALEENWNKGYDYFFFHVKKTDSYGEDGNFEAKKHVIEEFDKIIPAITKLNPDVILITGDHSTPCPMKAHSWHPVPIMIYSKNVRADNLVFSEKNCRLGSISRINAIYEIPLLLAHSGKLDKYGA